MSTLLPYPRFKAVDANGTPYSGGKVYTYIAGTSTAKASYSDAACATPNANPVVLDSNGEATIYLKGKYKIILKTSADVTVWTLDGVQGMGDWEEGTFYADYNEADQGAAGAGSSIKDLVDAIGSENATIMLVHNSGSTTTTYTLSTSLTIPSNISLKFQKGAKISIAATKTLTVNGVIEAGDHEILTGTGTLAGSPICGLFMSDWVNAGVTNSSTPTGTLKSIGASNAQGDVFYHNGTNITRLAAGTSGQILTTKGSSANPVWGNLPTKSHKNLLVKPNATNPNYQVDLNADMLVLEGESGGYYVSGAADLTIDITASGANGLHSGAEAASTWYAIYAIYNPTTETLEGLLVPDKVTPILPSGYTFKKLLGVVFNDAGSNFVGFRQIGNAWTYLKPRKLVYAGSTNVTASVSLIATTDKLMPDFGSVATDMIYNLAGKGFVNASGQLCLGLYTMTTSQDVGESGDAVGPVTSIRFEVANQTLAWQLPVILADGLIYVQMVGPSEMRFYLASFTLNL